MTIAPKGPPRVQTADVGTPAARLRRTFAGRLAGRPDRRPPARRTLLEATAGAKARRLKAAALAGVAAVLVMAGGLASFPRRDGLWRVVQACKLDARLSGKAWPCLHLDEMRGFALVPDLVHPTQVLLTPTAHLAGMESPELLASPTPNYWAQAWASRGWLDHRVHSLSTWSGVGMAVNSRAGRTQDQLHIHIDCLRQSMRDVLDSKLQRVTESWSDFPTRLVSGHVYRARWLARDMLDRTDPFRLMAADPQVRGRLAGWTLVLAPAHRPTGEEGFVLLSHRSRDPGDDDVAAGEELLDHRCSELQVRRLTPAGDAKARPPATATPSA